MRVIILALLVHIMFRLVKGLFVPRQELRVKPDGKVIDEMVQDPVCKTYIPRREAVKRAIHGKVYYFCSDQCAAKFKGEREE